VSIVEIFAHYPDFCRMGIGSDFAKSDFSLREKRGRTILSPPAEHRFGRILTPLTAGSSSRQRKATAAQAVWTESAGAIMIAWSRPGRSRALPHSRLLKDQTISEMVKWAIVKAWQLNS